MEELDNLLDSPSYRFFKELKESLPAMKCDNGICIENNLITKEMYLLTHSNLEGVTFKVKDDSVCCPSFKDRLLKEVDIIYQKHK